jgi:hypothetical protein
MRNETGENLSQSVALTVELLNRLKKRGFQYVSVNAFTYDRGRLFCCRISPTKNLIPCSDQRYSMR